MNLFKCVGSNEKLKVEFAKDSFEHQAWKNNLYVCGIDEVGRGCLAGPLVTAAVILPQNSKCGLLKDSKVLTLEKREEAYAWIIENCFYSYSILSHRQIDRNNIYAATLQSMKKSLLQLMHIIPFEHNLVEAVLVDAMPLSLKGSNCYKNLNFVFFDKGESKSSSIAAASIVAKVVRDRLMDKVDEIFPGFYFTQNKGYGASKHLAKLDQNDLTIIHRKTFLGKILNKKEENIGQKSIF